MASSYWKQSFLDVAITAASTGELAEIFVREGATDMWMSIENSPHKAFDAFQVSIKPHPDAAYQVIANAESDFVTNITPPIEGAGTDFTSLALSGTGSLWMKVKGLFAVKLEASAASGSDTTASVYVQQR